jgi:YidC/Oxa1 family membrane protein insertase
VLAPIEQVVSHFIVAVHSGLAHVAGGHQGWAWALAIVALVAVIRILLFPLFAKQSRSMRQMQLLQPKIKELQRKYADDKQAQQQELMKLYKETGVNPLGGCLPLIIQAPIFFALYRVLYSIRPPFKHVTGMTAQQAHDAGISTLFGTPIAAAFNSSNAILDRLSSEGAHVASPTTVKIVTALFIVAMSAATFVTTRQSMARSQAAQATSGADNPMLRQQKMIMYAMPVFLAVFGYRVPLGALIYWLANNVFTMIQQHFLFRKMDAEASGGDAPKGAPVPIVAPAGSAAAAAAPRDATALAERAAQTHRDDEQVAEPAESPPLTARFPAPCLAELERSQPARPIRSRSEDRMETRTEATADPETEGETATTDLGQLEQEGEVAADYLEGLLDIIDVDGDIDMDVEGDRASVAIVGAELDDLVGRRGEVLEALQELTRLAVLRQTGARSRLMLDISGFRARRRQQLTDLANRTAERVVSSGERVELKPMTPFERKIVHDAIAPVEGVRTESEGEEPHRYVVVLPA